MVTEIAGCGEERRPPVFVTAIARNLAHRCLRVGEPGLVGVVQRKSEQRQVVAAMFALAEPCADDHRAD